MSDRRSRLQVNVLSVALLCILLVPSLVETAKKLPGVRPRVVIVTSDAHYDAELDDAILAGPSPLRAMNTEEHYQQMCASPSLSFQWRAFTHNCSSHKKLPFASYAEAKRKPSSFSFERCSRLTCQSSTSFSLEHSVTSSTRPLLSHLQSTRTYAVTQKYFATSRAYKPPCSLFYVASWVAQSRTGAVSSHGVPLGASRISTSLGEGYSIARQSRRSLISASVKMERDDRI